jgi:hypothetical protein
LTVTGNTIITGTISAPINLKIETGARVTWNATTTGTVDTTVHLITITDDSADDGFFIVDLGSETLSSKGSVLVNKSEVPITVYGGKLESTETDDNYITLYSKGDVNIDSTNGKITISSKAGQAVFVEGANIEITGNDANQLTIKTEAVYFSAVEIAGGGYIAVTGHIDEPDKTLIEARGGNNCGIWNEDGNITVTHATVHVVDADSSAIYAKNGDVTVGGKSRIEVSGEKSECVYVEKGDVSVEGDAEIVADDDNCVGVYSEEGNVTVKGNARIEAGTNGSGGVGVRSEKGDVNLEDYAELTAVNGGPVVDARGGDINVGPYVTVYAGSAAGTALRASGEIDVDSSNSTITGKQLPDYNYNPASSSGGCNAGFGAIALIGLGLYRASGLRRRKA